MDLDSNMDMAKCQGVRAAQHNRGSRGWQLIEGTEERGEAGAKSLATGKINK